MASHRIKIHHNYTYSEVAEIMRCHPQTVRKWGNMGLVVIKDQLPHLILGKHLKEFLEGRKKAKRPLKPNQLFCLKCRAGKVPLGRMADFSIDTNGTGRLSGICPDCETMIHRFVGNTLPADVAPDLEISSPTQMAHGSQVHGSNPIRT